MGIQNDYPTASTKHLLLARLMRGLVLESRQQAEMRLMALVMTIIQRHTMKPKDDITRAKPTIHIRTIMQPSLQATLRAITNIKLGTITDGMVIQLKDHMEK